MRILKPKLLAPLLLSGCAVTGTQMQADCEAVHTAFPDIYRCTREAVTAKRPDIWRDDRAKLYLLRGEQLAQRVTDGAMSSLDARVEWQRMYVELRSARDAEVLGALAVMPKPAAPVTCTSTAAMGSVQTTCR